MRALFDVNVLIALLDEEHVNHQKIRAWLEAERDFGWASTPITQAGYARVVSSPKYPGGLSTPAALAAIAHATTTAYHEFWPDSLPLAALNSKYVLGPKQITDAYLLAVAIANAGRLVTFDRNINVKSVPGARSHHLEVI